MSDNLLSGPLPASMRDLGLPVLEFGDNSGLCLPATEEFLEWAEGIDRVVGPRCDSAYAEVLRVLHEATIGSQWYNSDGWLGDGSGKLTELRELNLSYNSLTGEIPPELGNLTNLELPDFDRNQLLGPVPQELGELSNLEELWLNKGGWHRSLRAG